MALGYLAFAWLLGIAAAAFTDADPAAALAAAALLAAVSFAVRPSPATLALIVAGVALVFAAAWRYDTTAPPALPTGVARYNDGDPVRLRTVVDAEPDSRGASTVYRLEAREALIGDEWRGGGGGGVVCAAGR